MELEQPAEVDRMIPVHNDMDLSSRLVAFITCLLAPKALSISNMYPAAAPNLSSSRTSP